MSTFDSETIAMRCERLSVSFLGHPFACLPLQVVVVVVVVSSSSSRSSSSRSSSSK